jgi:hypothetical protein
VAALDRLHKRVRRSRNRRTILDGDPTKTAHLVALQTSIEGLLSLSHTAGRESGTMRLFGFGVSISELPRQVQGITDPGVHALSAYGAVNVGGIAEEKCATFAKVTGDPVVHVIGRKPVHPCDFDSHALEDKLAYILPRKRPDACFAQIAVPLQ